MSTCNDCGKEMVMLEEIIVTDSETKEFVKFICYECMDIEIKRQLEEDYENDNRM